MPELVRNETINPPRWPSPTELRACAEGDLGDSDLHRSARSQGATAEEVRNDWSSLLAADPGECVAPAILKISVATNHFAARALRASVGSMGPERAEERSTSAAEPSETNRCPGCSWKQSGFWWMAACAPGRKKSISNRRQALRIFQDGYYYMD